MKAKLPPDPILKGIKNHFFSLWVGTRTLATALCVPATRRRHSSWETLVLTPGASAVASGLCAWVTLQSGQAVGGAGVGAEIPQGSVKGCWPGQLR